MPRRFLTALAICFAVLASTQTASAQFYWNWDFGLGGMRYSTGYSPYWSGYSPYSSGYSYTSSYSPYWSGYSPSYTSYYTPSYTTSYYTPATSYYASSSYYAPTASCCSSTVVSARPSSCCSTGCSQCCGTAESVIAGRVGTPTISAEPETQQSCLKCTVDDAQVFNGPSGMVYLDRGRGFMEITWGNRLHSGEIVFRREDDKFRYYEELTPPGVEAPSVPREWAVARTPCSQCKYALWHNHNESGSKVWTKVHSAKVACVEPLVPNGTPEKADDAVEQTDWKIVPPRATVKAAPEMVNNGWHAVRGEERLRALDRRLVAERREADERLVSERSSRYQVSRVERLRD